MFKALVTFLFMSSVAMAGPVKIAVIDSGYYSLYPNDKICATGSYDYFNGEKGVGIDLGGHGTDTVDLIGSQIKDKDYCFLIYKVIEPISTKDQSGVVLKHIGDAIQYAIMEGASYINISLSGSGFDSYEKASLRVAISMGIQIFVSAGNDGRKLSAKKCRVFEACYGIKGIHVVGALQSHNKRWKKSNYGKVVTNWEYYGYNKHEGTSIATAIACGKSVNRFLLGRKHDVLIRRRYLDRYGRNESK